MSGRKFMVVTLTSTYCICTMGALVCAVMNKVTIEAFLGIFAGFTPMVVLMNEWYFKREDRKNGVA